MRRLLLDTHAALWWWTDDPALSSTARAAIADPGAEVFVSAASVWEIAIKAQLGKLGPLGAYATRVPALMEQSRFRDLPVSAQHALESMRVRLRTRDPFDRILVAQATWEGLTLVTNDGALGGAVDVLW